MDATPSPEVGEGRVPAGRRVAAAAALAAGVLGVVLVVVVTGATVGGTALGLAAGLLVVAGCWRAFAASGSSRSFGVVVAALGALLLLTAVALAGEGTEDVLLRFGAVAVVITIGLACGHRALDHEIGRARRGGSTRWVEPCRRPVLIVNPRSGDGTAEEVDLEAAARERGIEVRHFEPGDDLAALAHAAVDAGADCLGMAGGDGSLAVVARVTHERGVPFVCVPAGTRNHLAADLALDRGDPVGALDAFGPAVERHIDYATVNGRLFLNNVSLGIYGDMVSDDRYRDDKLRTSLELIGELARAEREPYALRFRDPTGEVAENAYLVQVSNNPYHVDGMLDFGQRSRLDGGQLGIIAVRGDEPLAPAALVARAATGRLTADPNVVEWVDDDFVVEAGAARVWAGVDGEACELDSPLRFHIHPGGLRVRVPPANREASDRRSRRQARLRNLVPLALGRPPDPVRTGG